MAEVRALAAGLVCLLGLSACGDLPNPFIGNPGATARRLAQPPAPLLAIVPFTEMNLTDPAGRLLANDLATALQTEDVPAQAKRPQSTDWQLIARAEPRGETMVPVFTVRDPTGAEQGTTEGAPVPASDWAAAAPELGHQVAADVAPKVAALLTSIRITRDHADPNNLYNRAAKVMVAEVTGAPGDGNQTLTKQVRAHLAEYGPLVQTTKDGADFEVRGDVAVAATPNGKQRVEIVWTVVAANGDERGKVVQLNEIPAGTLDHYWGDVAVVVGTEAAGGVNDVILRQTGRTTDPPKPPADPAAESKPADAKPLPEPPVPLRKVPGKAQRQGARTSSFSAVS